MKCSETVCCPDKEICSGLMKKAGASVPGWTIKFSQVISGHGRFSFPKRIFKTVQNVNDLFFFLYGKDPVFQERRLNSFQEYE